MVENVPVPPSMDSTRSDMKKIDLGPPDSASNMAPSRLLRYLLESAEWTRDQYLEEVASMTPRGLSVGAIAKWIDQDGLPSPKNRAAFFGVIIAKFSDTAAKDWESAFKHAWRKFKAEPDDRTRTADQTLKKHVKWINVRYVKPIMGEPFSISDIYVPLSLHADPTDDAAEADLTSLGEDPLWSFARLGFRGLPDKSWLFVKGGPGSGKSVMALSLADRLSAEHSTTPLFYRLSHLADAKIIDTNAKTTTFGDSYYIETLIEKFVQSKSKSCCLILDGLDEIGGSRQTVQSQIDALILKLNAHIRACQDADKTLRIVAFGRNTIAEMTRNAFSDNAATILSLGSLAGSIVGAPESDPGDIGPDQREAWWKRYLIAKGLERVEERPEFLQSHISGISQFGLEPLLSYLICRTAFPPGRPLETSTPANEVIDQAIEFENRNSIYAKVIEAVRSSSLWRPDSLKRPVLDETNFVPVLQHIAVATWHEGSSRVTTVERIKDAIGTNASVLAAFNELTIVKPGRISADNLLTTFYYQVHQGAGRSDQNKIEFTHKTFSEYLLATLLFDKLEILISLKENAETERLVAALVEWAELVCAGPEEYEIAEFITSEAQLRLPKRDFETFWCEALSLIKMMMTIHPVRPQSGGQGEPLCIDSITRQKRACMVIFLLWSCLNKAHFDGTGRQFDLFGISSQLTCFDIKLILPVLTVDTEDYPNFQLPVSNPTFAGYCFSGTSLDDGDLSGIGFYEGTIQDASSSSTIFASTNWHRIDLDRSVMSNVSFARSLFCNSGWTETEFDNCDLNRSEIVEHTATDCTFKNMTVDQAKFESVMFIGCSFENVSFRKCVFVAGLFQYDNVKSRFSETTFEDCTFVNMRDAYQALPPDILIDCTYRDEQSG